MANMKEENSHRDILLNMLSTVNSLYPAKKKLLKFVKRGPIKSAVKLLKHRLNSTGSSSNYDSGRQFRAEGYKLLLEFLNKKRGAKSVLEINNRILSFSDILIREFIKDKIKNVSSAKNLADIFCSKDSLSVYRLAREENLYLEKLFEAEELINSYSDENVEWVKEPADSIINLAEKFDRFSENLGRDIILFREFVKDFTALYNEPARINIVGYGEISTVMEIKKGKIIGRNFENAEPCLSKWLWKKMPSFPDVGEVLKFEELYARYRDILVNEAGIYVPPQKIKYFSRPKFIIVYAGQERLNDENICHKLIKRINAESAEILFRKILEKLGRVLAFNKGEDRVSIGFDAQLSNWALIPSGGAKDSISCNDDIYYIDTSSPLIRIDNEEQLNAELFIKGAASFLRPVIRTFFLQDVLDRYYDLRSVIIDIIANLYKERREDLIDNFIAIANEFIDRNKISDQLLTRKEIDKYYSEDAFIWRLYQSARKIDRFITEKILRKKYPFRLPGKIER